MPSLPKVLGQAVPLPVAGALTTLYTVPLVTNAVISSVTACNTGSTAALVNVRVAKAVAGAAPVDDASQAVYDQVQVAPHETFTATLGLTLSAGDVVRVLSTQSGVAFSLFGTEVS